MKEFDFLLKDDECPDNIQEIADSKQIFNYLKSLIESGEKVNIVIPSREDDKRNATTLFVKFVKADKPYIVIDRLVPQSAEKELAKKKKSVVIFNLENVFYAFVIQTVRYSSRHKALLLPYPKTIYRLHMRRYFRVDASDEQVHLDFVMDEQRNSFKVNALSAGGLSFFTDLTYEDFFSEKNEEGEYWAYLFIKRKMMPVKIGMRNSIRSHNPKFRLVVGVEIIEIKEEHQEFIAQYVLAKQLEEIKKRRRKK